jgi:2-methylcitrate dehydratase PrpD
MCRNSGPSEIIPGKGTSSPFFASFINAASSHVEELDDVYNAAVLHPGTVVFPAALAAAQEGEVSGKELITASIVGYEAAARVGEFLGRSHYKIFHTTGTAGTFGAASTVSHILGADFDEMLNSFGSAGTQAAGLWEFLRDAADSKQLHTAKAASNGLLAAYISHDGFTGAKNILEGTQGLGVGTSTDADKTKLSADLGKKWAVMNTSLKYYASCRHTHSSADALAKAIKENDISLNDIKSIKAHVHQAAIDVLGPVTDPKTVHQSKFSMPFVLSLIALTGEASIYSFNEVSLHDQKIRNFMPKVELVYDKDVDKNYPTKWNGLVEIELFSGKMIKSYIESPKGDPDNFLTEEEIRFKFTALAKYSGYLEPEEINKVIDKVKGLENIDKVGKILD